MQFKELFSLQYFISARLSCLSAECSRILRNVGTILQDFKASRPLDYSIR